MPLPFRASPVDSTYAAPPKTSEKPARCRNGGIFAVGRRSVGGMTDVDAKRVARINAGSLQFPV